jgi:hypothetical protein
MTTPDENLPPDNDLTDAELDAALSAGDAELLDHVRTHTNPATTLAALFDDDRDAPERTSPGPPATMAARQIRARATAVDLDHALDHAITRVHGLKRFHDRNLPRVLARDLVRDLAQTLGLAGALARTLAHTLDLTHDRDFARVLARDLTRARDLVHDVALTRDLTSDLNRLLNRLLNRACDLSCDLADLPVNASGADLTGLNLSAQAMLNGALDGVTWDEGTRWPPSLRGWVAERSEEITAGVYQVRGGTERDPHPTLGR